jgi:hypothetical protein
VVAVIVYDARQQPRQKNQSRTFFNPAPRPSVPFRVFRPTFHFPVNDHSGGFETLPYIGHSPSVFAGNNHDKKPIPCIFQNPPRDHPFRFVLSVRRFIIP